MPLTIKDMAGEARAPAQRPPLQRNIASLVGGFVIAGGCFVLALLVAWQLAGTFPGWAAVAGAAVFAGAVGAWIRLADL